MPGRGCSGQDRGISRSMGSIDDRTEGTTELMRDAVCRSFEPRPEEVGAARRFAAGTVSQWGRDPAGAASVVSELAANAAMHGRTRFTVGVGEDESNIYITVDDDNPRLPTLLHPDRRSLSGRALAIVDRLAKRWGVQPHVDNGKTVWVELDAPEAMANE